MRFNRFGRLGRFMTIRPFLRQAAHPSRPPAPTGAPAPAVSAVIDFPEASARRAPAAAPLPSAARAASRRPAQHSRLCRDPYPSLSILDSAPLQKRHDRFFNGSFERPANRMQQSLRVMLSGAATSDYKLAEPKKCIASRVGIILDCTIHMMHAKRLITLLIASR